MMNLVGTGAQQSSKPAIPLQPLQPTIMQFSSYAGLSLDSNFVASTTITDNLSIRVCGRAHSVAVYDRRHEETATSPGRGIQRGTPSCRTSSGSSPYYTTSAKNGGQSRRRGDTPAAKPHRPVSV